MASTLAGGLILKRWPCVPLNNAISFIFYFFYFALLDALADVCICSKSVSGCSKSICCPLQKPATKKVKDRFRLRKLSNVKVFCVPRASLCLYRRSRDTQMALDWFPRASAAIRSYAARWSSRSYFVTVPRLRIHCHWSLQHSGMCGKEPSLSRPRGLCITCAETIGRSFVCEAIQTPFFFFFFLQWRFDYFRSISWLAFFVVEKNI